MKVIKVDYDHAYDLLNEIIDGKTAYDKVIRENLDNNITDETKEKILNRAVDYQFYDKLPHTISLLDDAMNILGKRKYENLYNLLYRNRQLIFLICACIQDSTVVQCQFKRNSDNIWIFGGNANKRNF
jgi:predicted house-cleaning noncanonical NTP pyrophosphatase (MazG superfamily)